MPPEMSPELTQAVAEETKEDLGPRAAEEPGEPQEEGGMEPEVEHIGSELEEEEEELGTEEQEEEQEPCEEPDNLGDPAVMRAVQSKPSLEVTPEQRGRGSMAGGPHTWVFCPTEGSRVRFCPYQGGMSDVSVAFSLQSQDSAVLDSKIGACWAEFDKEDVVKIFLLIFSPT